MILAEKVAAPARAGAVAPLDVYVPAGNTGMEPGKTSFFQALGVPTKIARGTIEITTDLKLVEAGTKVGASEATLLNMLNISPFTYGMSISQVYDGGQTFAPSVLDIKEEQLLKALQSAIATITSISLAANYPTLPSIMHSFMNGYKKVLAVAVETDYSWEGIDELKDRIANPDAYAAAAPAAATEEAAADAPKEEEKKEEEDGESSDEGGKFSKPLLRCLRLTTSKALVGCSTRSSLSNDVSIVTMVTETIDSCFNKHSRNRLGKHLHVHHLSDHSVASTSRIMFCHAKRWKLPQYTPLLREISVAMTFFRRV